MVKRFVFFIFFLGLLGVFSFARAQLSIFHYDILLTEKGGKWQVLNKAVLRGLYQKSDSSPKAVLYSFSGEQLTENGLLKSPQGEEQYKLQLPYFENGKEIKIIQGDKELYRFSVANFAKPKSITFKYPSLDIIIFSGLISLCKIPFS